MVSSYKMGWKHAIVSNLSWNPNKKSSEGIYFKDGIHKDELTKQGEETTPWKKDEDVAGTGTPDC